MASMWSGFNPERFDPRLQGRDVNLWRLPLSDRGRTLLLRVCIASEDRSETEQAVAKLVAESCRSSHPALLLNRGQWIDLQNMAERWPVVFRTDLDDQQEALRFCSRVGSLLRSEPSEVLESAPVSVPVVAAKQKTMF